MSAAPTATERHDRFRVRPDVQRVAEQYADWVLTSHGVMINVLLSGFAMLRLAGSMSRSEYRRAVRDLVAQSGIPSHDFEILARCSYETARYMLLDSGQLNEADVDGREP